MSIDIREELVRSIRLSVFAIRRFGRESECTVQGILSIKQAMEEKWMKQRHGLIPYALEEVPRPGAREICIRRPPDGFRIRNERSDKKE